MILFVVVRFLVTGRYYDCTMQLCRNVLDQFFLIWRDHKRCLGGNDFISIFNHPAAAAVSIVSVWIRRLLLLHLDTRIHFISFHFVPVLSIAKHISSTQGKPPPLE